MGHKHPQPPPPFEQWVLYPLNLLLTFIYIGIFLWGFSFNSLFIMAVEFLNQRSIEEFKSSNNISKLFIHKSVRKQVDENGNSILVPQRYENGTCKYFACDAAGKIFVAVSKAVCADFAVCYNACYCGTGSRLKRLCLSAVINIAYNVFVLPVPVMEHCAYGCLQYGL